MKKVIQSFAIATGTIALCTLGVFLNWPLLINPSNASLQSQAAPQSPTKPQSQVIKLILPTLGIVHPQKGRTHSGTVISIDNKAITLRRTGSKPTVIAISTLDLQKGVTFTDPSAPVYICSDDGCESKLRGPLKPASPPQELSSVSIGSFRIKNADTGQAEVTATPQLQSAAKTCRAGSRFCIVEAIRFNPTQGTMVVRFTPYIP